MINNIRNIQIYKADELSNDDYHGEEFKDYSSGSELWAVHETCPAQVRFGEHKETDALHFGTASHAAILEPDEFNKLFVRGIDKEDFDIKSDADIKAKLKEMGRTGYSTKKYPDLIIMLLDCDDSLMPFSLAQTIQEIECKYDGKTIVKPDDYDKITDMRGTMFNYPSNVELFKDSVNELSIFAEIQIGEKWFKVKCRPDCITSDRQIPDYKTTVSIEPEAFGRQAHNAGYWFKMAFTLDIVNFALGSGHTASLLAQQKTAPYLVQKYDLTGQQLQVGREQYIETLFKWQQCKDGDNFPAYFDGSVELFTPEWVANMYGFDDLI